MAVSFHDEPWYHGFISRQEAEEILTRGGKTDGLYLVRDSINQVGSYALSMCHKHRIIHYNAQRQSDGRIAIEDGPKFPGPVELVHYHSLQLDGLLCKLLKPCARLPGVPPKSNSGINQKHIRDAAEKAMESMGIVEHDPTMQRQMESFLGKVIHQSESWFHGNISREEAERRLQRCGCTNGLFLIRERKAPAGSYAMGLCYNSSVVHYLFDSDADSLLSIQSGPKFENLMLAVDHYTMHNDGLLHNLVQPCDIALFEERRKSFRQPEFPFPTGRPASRSFNEDDHPPRSPNGNVFRGAAKTLPGSPRSPGAAQPSPPTPSLHDRGAASSQNFESIYDSVKLKKSSGYINQFQSIKDQSYDLKSENLSLGKELGQGNFGSVLKGTYTLPSGEKLPVAVKRLKSEELNNPKSEILHEAKVMMKLDHPYIVRIIGMCTAPTMMLVMELAAEGPLNKYLKGKKNMEMLNILILMLQVAEGMQYLESQQFVHRDLAARNVLVVNESFIKISDFGMSRAMGAGSDYYKAQTPGKWPLKWYAPECVYFRKFSSKSDVWSYGVTLWEATSYGARPYQGMNGQIIIQKIENGYRLPAPNNVPMEVYKLMKSCWEYQEENRPSFKKLWQTLGDVICKLKG